MTDFIMPKNALLKVSKKLCKSLPRSPILPITLPNNKQNTNKPNWFVPLLLPAEKE